MMTPVLALSDRVSILPIIHGSGDCALEVRRHLLRHEFDCLAVPLPPSFQFEVERHHAFTDAEHGRTASTGTMGRRLAARR